VRAVGELGSSRPERTLRNIEGRALCPERFEVHDAQFIEVELGLPAALPRLLKAETIALRP
jgi:hypothetical protein